MNVINSVQGGTILGESEGQAEASGPAAFTASARPMVLNLISIARRRKWAVIGSVIAALLLGIGVTFLMTPLYKASATLEIQRETGSIAKVEGSDEESRRASVDQEFYQTQYGLLEARSLAERVATDLRLADNAGFFATFRAGKAEDWFNEGRLVAGASTREERAREAATILLRNVNVEPERQSRLVKVSFTSPDARLSKRVVDAWSNNFIEQTLERRFDATSYARRFLEGRLAQLRSKIDESERQLVTYASQEGIVNLPATTPARGDLQMGGERSLVAEDAVALNRELAQATADRIAAESRLGSADGSVIEALQNNAISTLRQRRAEVAAEYAKLMTQFEPNYPPALAVHRQLEEIDASLAREEQRVRRMLQDSFRAASSRESQLRSRVESLKGGLLDERRRSIQYNIIQREVDTNRQLYDALLQRYKEIGVAGGVGVNNISVVDPAEVPIRPSSPVMVLNLALALLVGLGAGIAVALILEQIDEAIADPAEAMQLIGAPLLGTVPLDPDADPIESLDDVKSTLSEAYLSLRTALSFATDHGVPNSFAITSTRASEGKSTTSYALARTLARSNLKVLLIDGDMRSPSMHGFFGMKNDSGLSNFLSGSENFDALLKTTSIANLTLMSAGPQPPSAPELLSSDRLEKLVEIARQHFDHVIIDAPPVLGLADAPLIGSRVESVVFVIEAHGTKKGSARVSVERLRAANSQVIGGVVTKFDIKRAHYGYGYDYGYGYGYGDGKLEARA